MKQQFYVTPVTVARIPKIIPVHKGAGIQGLGLNKTQTLLVPKVRLVVTKKAHVRKINPEETIGFPHKMERPAPPSTKRTKTKRRG